MTNSIKQIQKLLDEEREDAFINGVAEGYAVAHRIFVWYSSNTRLKEPIPLEELKEWSQEALETLKNKMSTKGKGEMG